MTDVDMDTVSWLVSSEYRIGACDVLADSMATPTGVADEMGKEVAHTSRALREMLDRGLVELLSSEDTKKAASTHSQTTAEMCTTKPCR